MDYSLLCPNRVPRDERGVMHTAHLSKPDGSRLKQGYSFSSNEAMPDDNTIDDNSQIVAMKMIIMKQQEQLGSLSSKLRKSHERRRTSVESLTDSPSGNFPMKLYDMLTMAEAQGLGSSSDAVAWLPHGRAFKILGEETFMASIVPLFFKMSKFRSFCRQLNLWGFKKVTSGRDIGAWYHENFIRGEPLAIMKMERTKVKRASSRLSIESQGSIDLAAVLPKNMEKARDILADRAKSSATVYQPSTKPKEFDLSILSKIRQEVASAFKLDKRKPAPVSSSNEFQF